MNRAVVIAIAVVGGASQVAAQTREVVGTVREAWTERPIANAEVSAIGQDGWVCTNDRGEYRLSVPSGAVNVIARYGELVGRPRAVASTDTVAALDVDKNIKLAPPSDKQVGNFWAIGGFVFAALASAPEIEMARGRYYVGGVELIVRPSHCGPAAPTRRGVGES